MRLIHIPDLPLLEPDPTNTHLLQIGKDVREAFEELMEAKPTRMDCVSGVEVAGDFFGWELVTDSMRSYVVLDSITDEAELRHATNVLASHCRNAHVAFVVVGE